MAKTLMQWLAPITAVEDRHRPSYQLIDFYGAMRLLRTLRTEIDETKAELFKSFTPIATNVERPHKVELHEIGYDPEYEDTVGFYDVVVDVGQMYQVATYRFEIVDGEFVDCGHTQPVSMSKSEYHYRRRKRTV